VQGKEKLRHLDEIFFHTRDEILKTLEKDKKYQECHSDSERIARQFPIIGELFEGREKGTAVELTEREQTAFREYVEIRRDIDKLLDGKGGITFSSEAQEAFQKYMRLNCNIDFRERQMYFWSGHIYSYEYLRKVGALKSEKD